MRRRKLLFSAVAVTTVALVLAVAIEQASIRKLGDITLLYVGADDCAPCRKWQRDDRVAFLTMKVFRRITYREVKSPILFDVLKDEYWPPDLRPYREQLGSGAGVPLWLVIADGRVVERQFGQRQWQAAILPKIKMLVR